MRHGNRALARNVYSFLLVFVFYSLFLVIPGSVCQAASPYINKVYEFKPAPGQFVHVYPKYDEGDTAEDMRQKAEEALANEAIVCLGGWGGYIVFGFDHMLVNVSKQRDLLVKGNAFANSAEPGVIYVSYDANGNGKPDDKWYEIAGSAYQQSTVNYQLTYYRPAANHVAKPDPNNKLIIDTEYILWRDKNNKTGYMEQNAYYQQSYFPLWLTADELTFSGTLLPRNAVPYEEGGITKYNLPAFDYGYADNQPNTSDDAKIDLDWAVDENGNAVHLKGVHFIKVMTGVLQQCGWIGETSTEILGAEDLHPDAPTAIENTELPYSATPQKRLVNGKILIIRDNKTYTVTGTVIQ